MAQWSNKDEAAGSVLWGPALVKAEVTEANRDRLYENDLENDFIDQVTTGQFAMDGGWALRTTGTGGRAGRVENERLVAMKSIEEVPEPPEPEPEPNP